MRIFINSLSKMLIIINSLLNSRILYQFIITLTNLFQFYCISFDFSIDYLTRLSIIKWILTGTQGNCSIDNHHNQIHPIRKFVVDWLRCILYFRFILKIGLNKVDLTDWFIFFGIKALSSKISNRLTWTHIEFTNLWPDQVRLCQFSSNKLDLTSWFTL